MDIAMAMALRHGWRIVRYLPDECGIEMRRAPMGQSILVTAEGVVTAYAPRRGVEEEGGKWTELTS